MYTPTHFKQERIDVLHRLVTDHPLGTLVTQQDGVLCADHIPFEVSVPADGAPFGVLRAHVARANPLWRRAGPVLVVFQGPSAYVTPALYEEKAVSGKVVPTWNYSAVHVHGELRAIEDPAWIFALLERLTGHHEGGREHPWSIHDAPREFLDKIGQAIIGIEIPIARLEGKFKLSQNRSEGDQERIAADTRLRRG